MFLGADKVRPPFYKRVAGALILKLLDRGTGEYIVMRHLVGHPEVAIKALQEANRKTLAEVDFSQVKNLAAFEDLHSLFSCNKSNRGVVRLDFNEAAHLFSVAKSFPSGNILEVGRFDGGSTLLLSVAAGKNARIVSVDNNPHDDETLKNILGRFNLLDRVSLIVGDSRVHKTRTAEFNMVFIDGDHSYEGVRADYDNLKGSLKPGGRLLFHDYSPSQKGVMRLIDDIRNEEKDRFELVKVVGSVADFRRI